MLKIFFFSVALLYVCQNLCHKHISSIGKRVRNVMHQNLCSATEGDGFNLRYEYDRMNLIWL